MIFSVFALYSPLNMPKSRRLWWVPFWSQMNICWLSILQYPVLSKLLLSIFFVALYTLLADHKTPLPIGAANISVFANMSWFTLPNRSLHEHICEDGIFLSGMLRYPQSVTFCFPCQRQHQQCGWAGVRGLRRTKQTQVGAGFWCWCSRCGVFYECEKHSQLMAHNCLTMDKKVRIVFALASNSGYQYYVSLRVLALRMA